MQMFLSCFKLQSGAPGSENRKSRYLIKQLSIQISTNRYLSSCSQGTLKGRPHIGFRSRIINVQLTLFPPAFWAWITQLLKAYFSFHSIYRTLVSLHFTVSRCWCTFIFYLTLSRYAIKILTSIKNIGGATDMLKNRCSAATENIWRGETKIFVTITKNICGCNLPVVWRRAVRSGWCLLGESAYPSPGSSPETWGPAPPAGGTTNMEDDI